MLHGYKLRVPYASTQPVPRCHQRLLVLSSEKNSKMGQTPWLSGAGEEFTLLRVHSREGEVGELYTPGFGSLSH